MTLYYLFPVSLIPVYHHRIWYFPVMGAVKRGVGGGGLHVSKERWDEKRKEGGPDTPFCTMTKQHSTKCKLNQVDLEEYKTLLDIYNY